MRADSLFSGSAEERYRVRYLNRSAHLAGPSAVSLSLLPLWAQHQELGAKDSCTHFLFLGMDFHRYLHSFKSSLPSSFFLNKISLYSLLVGEGMCLMRQGLDWKVEVPVLAARFGEGNKLHRSSAEVMIS